MTPINGYATISELVAFMPNSSSANLSQISNAIEAASRAIEGVTGKQFYPSVGSNKYGIDGWYPRELRTYEALLEVLTLTNGDASTIAGTEYRMVPDNGYPKFGITLNKSSAIRFLASATTGNEAAITLLGVWGWVRNYAAAWYSLSTLSAAIATTSVTTATIPNYQAFTDGMILRVDNELMRVTGTTPTTITIDRGWNGSTAATHLISAPVKLWQCEGDIKRACLIAAAKLYTRKYAINGTAGGGDLGVQAVTASGIMRDPDVSEILAPYTDNL